MRSPRARTVARRSAAIAGVSAFSALGILSLGNVASAATTPGTAQLTQELVPGLGTTITDEGAIPAATKMTVGVGMVVDTAARDAAYAALFTPGSPTYHQWYTPTSFEQAFGVSQAAAQLTRAWATRDGLSVAYAAPDGSYLELSGTAAQIDSTFSVVESNYVNGASVGDHGAIAAGRAFVANDVAPTVISTIAGVSGLNSLMTYSDTPAKAASSTTPAQDECASVAGECIGALTPSDIRSVYGIPSADLGQGQKIAIFGEGELATVVSQLRGFESTYGQPQVPVKEILVGDDLSDSSGDTEWELDSQASTGMAPDLQELDFYFGSSLDDPSITATYNAWAFDPNGPLTGNSSFGGAEPLEEADGFLEDTPLQQADMEGRTMFASAGDVGGSCLPGANGAVGTGVPCVEYPASSPYTTAVGGTILYTAATSSGEVSPATRADEYSWEYSGGGVSDFEKAPSWQPAAYPTGGDAQAMDTAACTTTGTCMRAVPDVSSLSGDVVSNGYAFYTDNAVSEEGGTSLSSPLWAGMWANVQAAFEPDTTCSTAGDVTAESAKATSAGFAPPDLYAIASTSAVTGVGPAVAISPTADTASFFDVGGATDSMQSTNQQQVTLARSSADPTGYDFISGLGSPMLTGIIDNVDCGNTTAVDPGLPGDPGTVTTYTYGVTPPYNDLSADGCGTNGYEAASGTVPATAVGPLELDSATLSSTGVDPTGSTTFSTVVASSAGLAATDDDYAFEFSYGSDQYAVTIDTGANPTAELYSLTTTSTPAGLGVQVAPTALASLTPTIDTATNTISTVLPWATFNSVSGQGTSAPYGTGSELTQLVLFSNAGPAVTALDNDFNADPADQIDFYQCPYVVSAAGPTPATPEAPYEVLLPLAAVAVGGVVLLRRRNKRTTV